MNTADIWIANDHGGYDTKRMLIEHLRSQGRTVINAGSDSLEIVRYPLYAARVCDAIRQGEAWRGILICSSGIGMSIIANRYRGVRAALCTSVSMARMTRAHNDSNVLCLGGKITGEFVIREIVDMWLSTTFEGGRHALSLGLIESAEKALAESGTWQPRTES